MTVGRILRHAPLSFLLAVGCQRTPDSKASAASSVSLMAFGPRTLNFDTRAGRAHNDYLLVQQPSRSDASWRAALATAIRTAPQPAGGPWAVRSFYVYEQSERVGPQFRGTADSLRGVHDTDLVAYARWTNGVLETMWLIERGSVVFDLLLDQPVTPAFEFD